MILIISEHNDKIRNMIINDLNRGVTVLKAQGGYSGQDKNVLLYQIMRIKKRLRMQLRDMPVGIR